MLLSCSNPPILFVFRPRQYVSLSPKKEIKKHRLEQLLLLSKGALFNTRFHLMFHSMSFRKLASLTRKHGNAPHMQLGSGLRYPSIEEALSNRFSLWLLPNSYSFRQCFCRILVIIVPFFSSVNDSFYIRKNSHCYGCHSLYFVSSP